MELRNLYFFVPVTNIITLQKALLRLGNSLNIKGTILLAEEGINAAISAFSTSALETMQQYIEQKLDTTIVPLITNLSEKNPDAKNLPFRKLKVRIRPEIVTLGVDGLQPSCITGEFVDPKDWNNLITDPTTITIDTRNIYEYHLGHFKGAVNPNTPTFRNFIEYTHNLQHQSFTKIAMYCTGGIRCEKATCFMKKMNIANTYQLKGGILTYFQQIPLQESLWKGVCFVFDDRIAVNKDMSPSKIKYEDIPQPLHKEKDRNRHAGHIYKKIISITQ